jgi:hypothetical protein
MNMIDDKMDLHLSKEKNEKRLVFNAIMPKNETKKDLPLNRQKSE